MAEQDIILNLKVEAKMAVEAIADYTQKLADLKREIKELEKENKLGGDAALAAANKIKEATAEAKGYAEAIKTIQDGLKNEIQNQLQASQAMQSAAAGMQQAAVQQVQGQQQIVTAVNNVTQAVNAQGAAINESVAAAGKQAAEANSMAGAVNNAAQATQAATQATQANATETNNASRAEAQWKQTLQNVDGELKKKNNTIKDAQAQNKRLREAVKHVTDEEEKEHKTRTKLNKKISENTEYIKRNSDSYTKLKMSIGEYSKAMKETFGGFMKIPTRLAAVAGAAIGVGKALASAFKYTMEFQKKLSNLAAILGKTTKECGLLERQALNLGRATNYTAMEVLELQTELSKLGFATNEVTAATPTVLKFAQACGVELGEAAQLAGSAIRGFGANAAETERYVSAMAVVTTKSALNFHDLETQMGIIAPVAHQFGFSIEDTLALLAQLRDAGMDNTMAATALRNVLLHLANGNDKLAKTIGGPVRTLEDLQAAFAKMEKAGLDLGTAFELTDKRAVAAFTRLVEGSDKMIPLRNQITGVTKDFDKMSKTQVNNAAGAAKRLESAWEDLMLSFRESDGPVAGVIDLIAELINGLNDLIRTVEAAQAKAKAEQTLGNDKRYNEWKSKQIEDYEKLRRKYLKQGLAVEKADEKAKEDLYKRHSKVYEEQIKKDTYWLNFWQDKKKKADKALKKDEERNGDLVGKMNASQYAGYKVVYDQLNKTAYYADLKVQHHTENLKNFKKLLDEDLYDITYKAPTGKGIKVADSAAEERRKQREAQERQRMNSEQLKQELEYKRKLEDAKAKLALDGLEYVAAQAKTALDNEFNALSDKTDEAQKKLQERKEKIDAARKGERNKVEMDAVERSYDSQIEKLENIISADEELVASKQKLTTQTKEYIRELTEVLSEEKKIAMENKRIEQTKRAINEQQQIIADKIAGEMKNSKEQFDLRRQQLNNQMTLELANTELTEEGKLAIIEKYAKQRELLQQEEKDTYLATMRTQYEGMIAAADDNERQVLAIKEQQALKELEYAMAQGQRVDETDAEYKTRMLENQQAYNEAHRTLIEYDNQMELTKLEAANQVMGGMKDILDAMGEDEKGAVALSKVLAIAQCMISIGESIAKVTAAESKKGIAGIATSAAAIAQIMTQIGTAIATIKSAKFASGGLVTGAGSGTSDSIPARLSNGESVMTARATSMFAPLLSAINTMGGGVPLNSVGGSNAAMGEAMLASAVARGCANIRPVVSVEEINRVTKRVEVLERNRGI